MRDADPLGSAGVLAAGNPDGWAARLTGEGARYFLASLAALIVDTGLLLGLTELARLNYLVGATVGFSAGLLVNYVLSVRFVFRERRFSDQRREFALFLLVGLAGLGLTALSMKLLVDDARLPYALAKVPTVGVVFLFNFALRKWLLFTRRAPR